MIAERKKEAIAILESELEYHRKEANEMAEELDLRPFDPVADVRIVPKEKCVLFTYDGAGNDYFTYHPGLERPRARLFAKLEEADFFAEDLNNWSMSIWDER